MLKTAIDRRKAAKTMAAPPLVAGRPEFHVSALLALENQDVRSSFWCSSSRDQKRTLATRGDPTERPEIASG